MLIFLSTYIDWVMASGGGGAAGRAPPSPGKKKTLKFIVKKVPKGAIWRSKS